MLFRSPRPHRKKHTSQSAEPISQRVLLESHDVVAAIHVNHLASDAAAGVGGEEDTSRADFFHVDISAEGGALGVRFQHVAEAGDAAGGEGLDGASGDCVHANVLLTEFVREITHRAFQAGFGYAHHVLAGPDFLRTYVSHPSPSPP